MNDRVSVGNVVLIPVRVKQQIGWIENPHAAAAPRHRLGRRVGWVNRRAEPVPAGGPDPDLVVGDLAALADALGA